MAQRVLNFLFELAGQVVVWCMRMLARLSVAAFWYAVAHPRSSIALGLAGAAVLLVGWKLLAAAVLVAFVAASTWKVAHRESFDRSVGAWLRTWARRWFTYHRMWDQAFTRCQLVVEVDNERHVPRLLEVSTTPYWDRVTLRMEVGQETADFRQAAEKLRHAFGAERAAVREIAPGRIGLDFMRRDPLRYESILAVPMPATTAEIDFSRLPVGLTEYLEPLTVSVVGGHLAAAGTPGAGKAGVIWNVLRSVAPAIADGSVKPVFIDPKAMELRQARVLVAPEDYAVKEEETLTLLERLVKEMEAAAEKAGELGERDFVPSVSRPLRLICIDELAPLLAYWSRRTRDKIEDALSLLLTQGRAVGFIVVGLIQEPTKDVFRVRDLFARRLGLRVPTEDHTDAALADKAVHRGALCHDISEDLPGVVYSLASGAKTAVRGRLGYVSTEDIADLVEYVHTLRTVTSLDSRRAEKVSSAWRPHPVPEAA